MSINVNPADLDRFRTGSSVSILARNDTQDSDENSENSHNLDQSFSDGEQYRTLTTFSGVFAPVCLSMFSAILFLRLGFILGNSGLFLTLFELLLAYGILIFTVFSICAIATNGAIQGGGVYYMISRALGPEFGGSIGLLFFIANVFSSALYLTGCIEGIMNNFGPSGGIVSFLPSGYWWSILYGSALNFLNMIICLVGAALFAKTSVVILVTVLISTCSVLVSLWTRSDLIIAVPHENDHLVNETLQFTGFNMTTFTGNLMPNFTTDYSTNNPTSFPLVFGVLFSGVTGIMAGANVSGELKEPGESIPKGTIRAVLFTFFVYVVIFLTTAATCPRLLLQNNFLYMQALDYAPVLVAIGIFAATFSASLSNLIGASRVLEALAKDKIFGSLLNPIAKLSLPGNPICAVLLTWLLVQCIIFINKLNLIAQITSVFFLLSYCATNLACLALTLTSAPNFRPSFKQYSWRTAAIGIVGTFVMMFVINMVYATITVFLCFALVIMLHIRSPPQRWGSITQALIFHQVRKYLLILDVRKDHVKYWRPHILLMVANPRSCIPLIRFANDLKKSGMFLICHVKIGNLDDYQVDPILNEYPLWLQLLDMLKVKAFFEVTLASTVREGFYHLLRISGLGAMKPNTIFFGFYDEESQIDFFQSDPNYASIRNSELNENEFLKLRDDKQRGLTAQEYVVFIYETIFKFQKNVCIGRYFNSFNRDQIPFMKDKTIDIWPINFFAHDEEIGKNAWKYLLQLACIVQMVPGWKNSTQLRLLVSDKFPSMDMLVSRWERRLKKLRIDCKLYVLEWDSNSLGSHRIDLYNSNQTEIDRYFKSTNQFIHYHSREATLVFMYLPAPSINQHENANYLSRLTVMTERLPPTILVHGISEVTSDSL